MPGLAMEQLSNEQTQSSEAQTAAETAARPSNKATKEAEVMLAGATTDA